MIWAVLQSASSGHCYATNAKQTSLERNFLADMNSITVDHGNCSPRLQAPIQGVSSSIQRHCNVKCMQIFCTTIKKGNSKWVIRMIRIHKDQGGFYSHYFMCRHSLGTFDCWYIDNFHMAVLLKHIYRALPTKAWHMHTKFHCPIYPSLLAFSPTGLYKQSRLLSSMSVVVWFPSGCLCHQFLRFTVGQWWEKTEIVEDKRGCGSLICDWWLCSHWEPALWEREPLLAKFSQVFWSSWTHPNVAEEASVEMLMREWELDRWGWVMANQSAVSQSNMHRRNFEQQGRPTLLRF